MSIMDEVWIQILNDDEGQPRIQQGHIKIIMREYVNNKDLSELPKLEFDSIHPLLSGECPNCKKSVFRSFEGQGDYGSNGRVEIEFYNEDGINIICPHCHTNIEIWDKYFAYLFNHACANGESVYLSSLTDDYRFKLKEKRKEAIRKPLSVEELLNTNKNMNKYEDLLCKVKEGLINAEKISNGCINFNIKESYSNEDTKKLKDFYNADTGFKNIEVKSLDEETNFKFYYE